MRMPNVLRHSLWICWKDVVDISRNRLGMVMIVVMPFFMMTMVGFIFPSMDGIKHTPIAFADQDEGVNGTFYGPAFEANFRRMNDESGTFDLTDAEDLEDIKRMIREGSVSGGLVLPPDFTAALRSGRCANVTIVTDQSNPQMSIAVKAALQATVEQLGTLNATQTLNQTYGVDANYTLAVVKPYKMTVVGLIPGNPSYFQFVAPGIMGMVVMMSLMTGLPHAISYEKDIGTLDGMLVAPINRLSIILGKVMAQTLRGVLQGSIILLLAVLVFGVRVYGSFLLVCLLVLLSVYSFVGLGILITSFADKEETASMIMMTFMFPMIFLSGVFFPVQQMPWYMQMVSKALPLTYATTALRKVVILGAGYSEIVMEVLYMAVFGTVLLLVAVPMFKRAMNR